MPKRSSAPPARLQYVIETLSMSKVVAHIGQEKWNRVNPDGCHRDGCNNPFSVAITTQARINGEPEPLTVIIKSCDQHAALIVSDLTASLEASAEQTRAAYHRCFPETDVEVDVRLEQHEPVSLQECREIIYGPKGAP